MATKTGIGTLKHKLSGLRRNSAKVLKKTNSLVSGALSQLKRTDAGKHKAKASASSATQRKPAGTVKPAGAAKRPALKVAKSAPARAPKKARVAVSPPVALVPPAVVQDLPHPPLPAAPTVVRAVAGTVASPVKPVVAPVQQRAGSVLDFQLPTKPMLRRLAPTNPSPDSRASRATSKGKHAALSTARVAAIEDAGATIGDGTHDTV